MSKPESYYINFMENTENFDFEEIIDIVFPQNTDIDKMKRNEPLVQLSIGAMGEHYRDLTPYNIQEELKGLKELNRIEGLKSNDWYKELKDFVEDNQDIFPEQFKYDAVVDDYRKILQSKIMLEFATSEEEESLFKAALDTVNPELGGNKLKDIVKDVQFSIDEVDATKSIVFDLTLDDEINKKYTLMILNNPDLISDKLHYEYGNVTYSFDKFDDSEDYSLLLSHVLEDVGMTLEDFNKKTLPELEEDYLTTRILNKGGMLTVGTTIQLFGINSKPFEDLSKHMGEVLSTKYNDKSEKQEFKNTKKSIEKRLKTIFEESSEADRNKLLWRSFDTYYECVDGKLQWTNKTNNEDKVLVAENDIDTMLVCLGSDDKFLTKHNREFISKMLSENDEKKSKKIEKDLCKIDFLSQINNPNIKLEKGNIVFQDIGDNRKDIVKAINREANKDKKFSLGFR